MYIVYVASYSPLCKSDFKIVPQDQLAATETIKTKQTVALHVHVLGHAQHSL